MGFVASLFPVRRASWSREDVGDVVHRRLRILE